MTIDRGWRKGAIQFTAIEIHRPQTDNVTPGKNDGQHYLTGLRVDTHPCGLGLGVDRIRHVVPQFLDLRFGTPIRLHLAEINVYAMPFGFTKDLRVRPELLDEVNLFLGVAVLRFLVGFDRQLHRWSPIGAQILDIVHFRSAYPTQWNAHKQQGDECDVSHRQLLSRNCEQRVRQTLIDLDIAQYCLNDDGVSTVELDSALAPIGWTAE